MGQATEAATPHLRLVNTGIEDKTRERVNATDWQACAKCKEEYEPPALSGGVCNYCRAEEGQAKSRLAEALGRRAGLIRMAGEEFQITEKIEGLIMRRVTSTPQATTFFCLAPRAREKQCSPARWSGVRYFETRGHVSGNRANGQRLAAKGGFVSEANLEKSEPKETSARGANDAKPNSGVKR